MRRQALFDLASIPTMVLVIAVVVLFGTWLGSVGYLMSVSKIDSSIIPLNKTEITKEEAISLVKKRCENEKNNYVYSYNNIKKTDNEWRIPIMNVNCPCYAIVDVKTGGVDCMKEISFSQEEVAITTDKTEYEQGDVITVIVTNNKETSVFYYSFPFMLYKHKDGEWKAFVYPWRSGLMEPQVEVVSPFEEIEPLLVEMKTDTGEVFSDLIDTRRLAPGRYRVEFQYTLDHNKKVWETIYSNEFTIKEKSALDLRCSEKVKGVGPCDEYNIGYEFNSETEKCIRRGVSGCSFEIPFSSLEECQEVCEKKDMSCEQATDCIEKCPKCVDKSQLRTNCSPRFKCVNGICGCECICLSM